MNKQVLPYGTWPSHVTAQTIAADLGVSDVQWDSQSETLVWREEHAGKGILVSQKGFNAPRRLTDIYPVRASIGYGGGDFTVGNGAVIFACKNGRLFRQNLSLGAPYAITPPFGGIASPALSPDGKWVAYLHQYEGKDCIALVDSQGQSWPEKIMEGHDFYMQISWHTNSSQLCMIRWKHPQMPWDGTELVLFDILTKEETWIAGDATNAIFQGEFSPDGKYLSYISNQKGWPHIYIYDLEEKTHQQLTFDEAEYSTAPWLQGMRTYAWRYDSQGIYFIRFSKGRDVVGYFDLHEKTAVAIDELAYYTSALQISASKHSDKIALLVSAPNIPKRVVSITPGEELRIHFRTNTEHFCDTVSHSIKAITWKGHDNEEVYGLYHPPESNHYSGTALPPLIIDVHGGPTSQRKICYEPKAKFFTSRGFAFLQVNYRGSTGYGKIYMDKLLGNWGIYDVEDCATGAQYLIDQKLVDANKIVIMGGSSGGFSVLHSLITKPGFYKAGICLYGVSNQFLLASDTHKFEKHYLDQLLGPLPEAADIYRERSPYFHADKIKDPLAIFQGEVDRVVPKNQSDCIVESLINRGIPHEYHVYKGEGHGWKKPETIEAFYQSLLAFLKQYVIFA